MSDLCLETWTMPAADLGLENPLLALHSERELPQVVERLEKEHV